MARKRKDDAAVDEQEQGRQRLRADLLAARDANLRAQYAPEPKDYAILAWPELVTWLREAVETDRPDLDTATHYLKCLLAEFHANRAGIHRQCERLLLLSEGMTEHERFLEIADQIEFNVIHAIGTRLGELAGDYVEDDISPDRYLTLESTLIRRVLALAGLSLFKGLPDFNCNAARRRLRRERAILAEAAVPQSAVWLGDGRFSIDGEIKTLDGSELAVAEALVKHGALTKPQLESKSKVSDAVGVLNGLIRKFPGCFRKPGGRNKGGYGTTIRLPD